MNKIAGQGVRTTANRENLGQADLKPKEQAGKTGSVAEKERALFGPGAQQDEVLIKDRAMAVGFKPAGKVQDGPPPLNQLGLLQAKQADVAKQPASTDRLDRLTAAMGDKKAVDGDLARSMIEQMPDFNRDDLRYLLGWRPDPNAVIGGAAHHVDKVTPFNQDAVQVMLEHFGNITPDGEVSIWNRSSTFDGDRRLPFNDIEFMLQSDGKIDDGIEQKAKDAIDADDPLAAMMAELEVRRGTD